MNADFTRGLNWLDFEVQSDKWEYQTLQVLNEVIEATKTLWIFRRVDIDEWANFGGGEWNVSVTKYNF